VNRWPCRLLLFWPVSRRLYALTVGTVKRFPLFCRPGKHRAKAAGRVDRVLSGLG